MRSGVFFVLTVMVSVSVSVYAYDWSTNPGDGSLVNPYQISQAGHLASIGADPNLFDKHFVLTDDIVLPAPATTGPNTFNCPVIGSITPFTGTFNGQGHSIAGLYLEGYAEGEYVGLFGIVESLGEHSGVISNLILAGPTILTTSHLQSTGGLVGHLVGGELFRCAVTQNNELGNVTGSVTDIGNYNNVAYIGEKRLGGLIGLNTKGDVIQCYTNIEVQMTESASSMNYIGGMIGQNMEGSIESCYSKATVGKEGTLRRVDLGGMIGRNSSGSVMTSYSVPTVGYDDNPVGVIAGEDYNGSYYLCYADPNGVDDYTVTGAYVKSPSEMMSLETFRGWGDGVWVLDEGSDTPRLAWEQTAGTPIIDMLPAYGGGAGTVEDPYQIWDANHLNTLGYYRSEFDKHFILMDDLDFEMPTDGARNFQPIGAPCVPFSGTFEGNGKTISGLYYEGGSVLYVGLFGGIVGDDACVENLTLRNTHIEIDGKGAGALAGYIEKATIQNCDVDSASISGDESVGGLAGWLYSGDIKDCRVSGVINGDNMVGGFAGQSGAGGSGVVVNHGIKSTWIWYGNNLGDNLIDIQNCMTNTAVTGVSNVGGFCGTQAWGQIKNSFSNSVVNGKQAMGGFTALAVYAEIHNCYTTSEIIINGNNSGLSVYASGFVGNASGSEFVHCYTNQSRFVEHEYWDPVFTSCYYLGSTNGGMRLDEAAMKTQASFVGWDFVGESANGDDDVWRMCVDGVSFPRLSWEFSGGDVACPDGVQLDDLAALGQCWLDDVTAGCGHCDIDRDGEIDLADLEVISDNWLTTWLGLEENVIFISVLETGPNLAPFAVGLMNTGQRDAGYMIEQLSGSDWLDMTPVSGTILAGQSENLTVSVDVIGPALEPGIYEADFSVTSEDACNSPVEGKVVLQVVNRYPELALDRDWISLTARETGPNPIPQIIEIENSGNEDAEYTIEFPGGQPDWLVVSPLAGTIGQGDSLTLSVSADAIGSQVEPGEYQQKFHVVCPEDPDSPYAVQVQLNVAGLEELSCLHVMPPGGPSFWVSENGPNPEPERIDLWNYEFESVDFTVDYPGGRPDWLTVTPTSGTVDYMGPTSLTISVDVVDSNILPGMYEQEIHIYDNEQHVNPEILTVYLEVIDQYPYFIVPDNSVFFSVTEGGPNPAPETIHIDNIGDDVGDYTIEFPDGRPEWLSVTPISGTVLPMDSTSISVSADVVGTALTAGTYSSRFQIVAPESPTSPLEVRVDLEVTEP